MQLQIKDLLKYSSWLLVTLAIAFGLASWVLVALFPSFETQIAGWSILPIFYWIFCSSVTWFYFRLRGKVPQLIMRFYLVSKALRFMVTLLVFIGYAIFAHTFIAQFALTLVLLYLVVLVYDSIYFVRLEAKIEKNEKN